MRDNFNFIVVDDDPYSNIICRLVIKKYFNAVDIQMFTEPQVALEFIADNYKNLTKTNQTILLLDVNMPLMSGWDFLKEFEKLGDGICNQFNVYMLSSSVDDKDFARAKKNKKVIEYLIKPLTKERLMDVFGNEVR